MKNKVSRRDVLVGGAAVAVGIATRKAPASPSPTVRKDSNVPWLRFGIIGCGGKGWSGMEQASEHGPIVAICDIDAENRSKAMMEHPRAAAFDDYRAMFDAMEGKLDAVVISTPDHHHAIASALAMKQGLHTYCEKPLTRTIWEARQIALLAKKHRVATQMGNQSTASTPMRKIAALIRSGYYGNVTAVHLWTDRAAGWWAQGVDRPDPSTAPKKLNWDTWVGPSPRRSFAEGYHPFAWRGWWDFGTGALGDMGCHIFNTAHMALNLNNPISVQAETSGHNKDSFPAWSIVTYEFASNSHRPGFVLTWSDGGKRPDARLVPGFEYGGNGSIIVCEKATIYCPNELNMEYHVIGSDQPEIKVDESPGHMAEFARAALGGPPAKANFPDYAGPMAETVLLGNLAIWANGPKLDWDARNIRVRGTNEYDSLIRPSYAPGWALIN